MPYTGGMSDLIPCGTRLGRTGALIVLLGLIGLWLMYRMVWRYRGRTGPRCPRCQYDLRATGDAAGCPECGDLPKKPGKRLARRPRYWRLLPGLLIAIALPLFIVVRHTHHRGAGYWLRWGPGYWVFGQEHTGTDHLGPFTLDWCQDRRSYGAEKKLIIQPSNIELTGYSFYMWQPL